MGFWTRGRRSEHISFRGGCTRRYFAPYGYHLSSRCHIGVCVIGTILEDSGALTIRDLPCPSESKCLIATDETLSSLTAVIIVHRLPHVLGAEVRTFLWPIMNHRLLHIWEPTA